MLNSATGTQTIHFGPGATIDVNSVDVTMSALGISVNSASQASTIETAARAQSALSLLSQAILMKDSARASFGYKMNRIESTASVLDIQAENVMTAESRISDVDVATEMAVLTRNQVLAQAGVSMLAQANTTPQMALTLLR